MLATRPVWKEVPAAMRNSRAAMASCQRGAGAGTAYLEGTMRKATRSLDSDWPSDSSIFSGSGSRKTEYLSPACPPFWLLGVLRQLTAHATVG